jgi:integrase/recombinase XerD
MSKNNNIQEPELVLSKVAGFTDYLLQKGYSTNTIERYAKDVDKFKLWVKQENQSMESIRQGDILFYIQGKKITNSQRSISVIINSIKHYYNYLIAINISVENPARQIQIKGIKRKVLYHILSKKELEKLYNDFGEITEKPKSEQEANDKAKKNLFENSIQVSKRNKVILGLIIYQGLGTSELSRLTEKDLKLREGKIFISGTRRSNEREMKLEAHQIMDIMEYQLKIRKELLEQSKKESDKLFISTGSSERFSNIIQGLMKKLKKQHSKITSLKQIRSSVITHWLKIHNLRQVQYMAGHRYVSSTEAYLINDLDDLSEEVNKYHPI